MLAVTKIIIEKHCGKVLLRSHILTVLSPLKQFLSLNMVVIWLHNYHTHTYNLKEITASKTKPYIFTMLFIFVHYFKVLYL